MREETEKVIIVEDDPTFRRSLRQLLEDHGYLVEDYISAEHFLTTVMVLTPLSCLVADIHLPGMSGLQLHRELAERGINLPTVCMTAEGDVPTCAQAMKQGVVDFITKPFELAALLSALRVAFTRLRLESTRRWETAQWQHRLLKLSLRELEVLPQIVSGKLNKQIGADLGITEKTVKVHRAHIHRKLEVTSLAELVRMAVLHGDTPHPIGPKSNSHQIDKC